MPSEIGQRRGWLTLLHLCFPELFPDEAGSKAATHEIIMGHF